jgi:hypothetical protein
MAVPVNLFIKIVTRIFSTLTQTTIYQDDTICQVTYPSAISDMTFSVAHWNA